MTANEKIVVYPSKMKYFLFSALSVFFTLLSALLILMGLQVPIRFIDIKIEEGSNHAFLILLGIIWLVIFSMMALYYILRLVFYKPSLIIDKDGIFDNAAYTSAGYLKWTEIESICLYNQKYKIGSQKALGINLKNKDAFMDRCHGFKKISIEMAKYPVIISQNAINIRIEDLHNVMNSYLNQ